MIENENITNALPELPTGEDMIEEELKKYLLDASEDYPEPHYLLEYRGVGFSPLGGIQAISGQKKNGKTFVLTELMSAILGAGTERVEAKLPGLKLRDDTREYINKEPTVLYVDTEMEKLNTAKVMRRVHWLCGWDMKQNNQRFKVLWLREEEDAAKKLNIVRQAITLYKPTAVFIDGIRDLIIDFNNLAECAPLVAELMKIATQNDCCIWNVLHMNPRPSNDDESKMRGHLGTELGNKVTDTFVSIKKKEANGQVTFTVKQQDARGKDIEDWTFEITDDAGGLGIPRIISPQASPAVEVDNIEDIRRWITDGQHEIEWPASLLEIKKLFQSKGVTNHDRLQLDVDAAKNRRFILPQVKSEYEPGQKKPKYNINPNEIDPF